MQISASLIRSYLVCILNITFQKMISCSFWCNQLTGWYLLYSPVRSCLKRINHPKMENKIHNLLLNIKEVASPILFQNSSKYRYIRCSEVWNNLRVRVTDDRVFISGWTILLMSAVCVERVHQEFCGVLRTRLWWSSLWPLGSWFTRPSLQEEVSGICQVRGAAVPSGRECVLLAHSSTAALERGLGQRWVALEAFTDIAHTLIYANSFDTFNRWFKNERRYSSLSLCSGGSVWTCPGQVLLLSNQVSVFDLIRITPCTALLLILIRYAH